MNELLCRSAGRRWSSPALRDTATLLPICFSLTVSTLMPSIPQDKPPCIMLPPRIDSRLSTTQPSYLIIFISVQPLLVSSVQPPYVVSLVFICVVFFWMPTSSCLKCSCHSSSSHLILSELKQWVDTVSLQFSSHEVGDVNVPLTTSYRVSLLLQPIWLVLETDHKRS